MTMDGVSRGRGSGRGKRKRRRSRKKSQQGRVASQEDGGSEQVTLDEVLGVLQVLQRLRGAPPKAGAGIKAWAKWNAEVALQTAHYENMEAALRQQPGYESWQPEDEDEDGSSGEVSDGDRSAGAQVGLGQPAASAPLDMCHLPHAVFTQAGGHEAGAGAGAGPVGCGVQGAVWL
jgi:hypothetical protein